MPKRYEAVKRSIRKRNPGMSSAAVKTKAAKIANGTRKPGQAKVTRGSK
jgi:hypothetical protein